jgi:transposase-like protein
MMNDKELNLATLSNLFVDEEAARAFLESKLWPEGPVCPHCGSCDGAYKLEPKPGSKKPVRKGVYCCKACRKQFTVRVGTVFEDSHIPLCKWLMAFHLMMSSKKGISSLQISRELDITVKSAWFLTHRIREALRSTDGGPLRGMVEADETYVGGKSKGRHHSGRGTEKTPVLALVERDGRIRAKPLERVDGKTLKNEVAVNIAKEAIVMTDELNLYRGIREDRSQHRTVMHSIGEYARLDPDGVNVHTNTAESFFCLLKRGHYGIFHQISKRHLHRYCDEFSFRWDHRKSTDGERMVAAIRGAEGKRLMYRRPGLQAS